MFDLACLLQSLIICSHHSFRALIIYAYLGEVEFAPLKSENKAHSSQVDPYKPPLCSPKSMYRLAEKVNGSSNPKRPLRLTKLQYDIPDLKEEALKDIQSKLSPHNILEELFSTFTSLCVILTQALPHGS